MKRILFYTAVCSVAITALISVGYATAKTDNNKVANIDNNLQSTPTGWRLVKQTFQLHIPKNSNALSQLIIDTPSTVAVSNDIEVLDEQGEKFKINVSADGRRIIIDFPQPVTSNTKLFINLNEVKQPIFGSASIYHLSVKVIGNNKEIPVGVAQFPNL
ncbi:DUF2808 domain-containing protein [Fischerella sp. JS2]|uniref:DUF2808 domain-containing protein n=1 Tax=Fischerella sp. JS2 TaxID=2597771 RepID=UPI0028E4F682|nr:DUF2808 domain-containing protein [Fischerella sp. JS2]